jgi:uncharacterized protein involved in exopolysaccharide biosynthesis
MTDLGTTKPMSQTLGAPRVQQELDPELSLATIISVLRQNLRMIAIFAITAPILAAFVVLLTERTWTASAAFLPESRRSGGGGLSSLAMQYGVNLGGMVGGEGGQSLQFYTELVRSREILQRLVADSLVLDSSGAKVAVTDFLKVKGDSPAERYEDGLVALRGIIQPSANPTTGIVRIRVTTESATASQILTQRTLDLLNEFNLERRQSQGATERRFAEQRLSEMTDSLGAAEQRLQAFEQRNAQYETSPHLRMEQRRLMNNLAAKQTLHTALAQSYEQARIEEVRDTPVITTLERPTVPVRSDSRRGLQKMMLAFVVAIAIGVVLAFARSNLAYFRQS